MSTLSRLRVENARNLHWPSIFPTFSRDPRRLLQGGTGRAPAAPPCGKTARGRGEGAALLQDEPETAPEPVVDDDLPTTTGSNDPRALPIGGSCPPFAYPQNWAPLSPHGGAFSFGKSGLKGLFNYFCGIRSSDGPLQSGRDFNAH